MRATPNWRLALILAAMGGVAGACILPYVHALTPTGHALSPSQALLVTALQTAVVCFLMAWAGLAAGRAIGLDAPLLRARLDGTPLPPRSGRTLLLAAGAGVLVGLVIVLLDRALPAGARPSVPSPARWKGLLACAYGGVVEELQLRLFLMTLLARLLVLVARRKDLSPSLAWIAIGLAALIFGAGHLPLAARLGPLTALVVTRVIALNGIAGLLFGWLYWRRGLEHAMAAHFAADLVLHVAL